MPGGNRAFTLVELLVVVAILAILAAIAIPNLLEAQTRAKISRVRSDLRTLCTGLEAYMAEHQNYPPGNELGLAPPELTTPVAYLASIRMHDPLAIPGQDGGQHVYYRYNPFDPGADFPDPADSVYVRTMFGRFGPYITYGNGPTQVRGQVPVSTDPPITILLEYDPTNGTISPGRIMRYPKQKA